MQAPGARAELLDLGREAFDIESKRETDVVGGKLRGFHDDSIVRLRVTDFVEYSASCRAHIDGVTLRC
jgi:hypothetical protein